MDYHFLSRLEIDGIVLNTIRPLTCACLICIRAGADTRRQKKMPARRLVEGSQSLRSVQPSFDRMVGSGRSDAAVDLVMAAGSSRPYDEVHVYHFSNDGSGWALINSGRQSGRLRSRGKSAKASERIYSVRQMLVRRRSSVHSEQPIRGSAGFTRPRKRPVLEPAGHADYRFDGLLYAKYIRGKGFGS